MFSLGPLFPDTNGSSAWNIECECISFKRENSLSLLSDVSHNPVFAHRLLSTQQSNPHKGNSLKENQPNFTMRFTSRRDKMGGNVYNMLRGTENYLIIIIWYQNSCNKGWYHWGKHSISQDVGNDCVKVSLNFSSLWQHIKVLVTAVSLAASADLFLLVTG